MYLDAIIVLIDKEIEENNEYIDHLEKLLRENSESSENATASFYQESMVNCKAKGIVLSNFRKYALQVYKEVNP